MTVFLSMDAGIGAKATSWTAWGAMAKASAHRCKRDMAWSEDAGRERTKAWMQASDKATVLDCMRAMAKALRIAASECSNSS